ncbi:double-stranded RNA-binding protein 1 [Lathyrus oleraceus]|nr:double-stranded RNA-binding protein 1-like [Pisum sativum]
MYKTQLQQLCQQRRWSLPKYSAMNDGPQHKPSYKASVLVNDATFTSSDTFNSTKEAQNQAAMRAFLNLSSHSSGSSTPTEEVGAAKPQETPVIMTETARLMSKHQLQNYARKNHLDPPVFTVKTEGLPHDIRYKATVVIGGKSFDSQTFFNTRKEAEQAAANVALMELPISVDLFQKGESCPPKSLLLELTQREGFSKPTYKTTESRSSNMPSFFSTVEVEGVEFHGKASRSKKQAEHDAAKIAYIALQEYGLHMYASFSSSTKENMAIQSTHKLDIVKSMQIPNCEGLFLYLHTKTYLINELLDQEILL